MWIVKRHQSPQFVTNGNLTALQRGFGPSFGSSPPKGGFCTERFYMFDWDGRKCICYWHLIFMCIDRKRGRKKAKWIGDKMRWSQVALVMLCTMPIKRDEGKKVARVKSSGARSVWCWYSSSVRKPHHKKKIVYVNKGMRSCPVVSSFLLALTKSTYTTTVWMSCLSLQGQVAPWVALLKMLLWIFLQTSLSFCVCVAFISLPFSSTPAVTRSSSSHDGKSSGLDAKIDVFIYYWQRIFHNVYFLFQYTQLFDQLADQKR